GALQKSLTKVALDERTDRQGGGKARFVSIDWHCNDDPRNAEAITGRPLTISFVVRNNASGALRNVAVAAAIYGSDGGVKTTLMSEARSPLVLAAGTSVITCRLDSFALSEGTYTINLALRERDVIEDWVQEAAVLNVEYGDFFGNGAAPPKSHPCVLLAQEW